MKRLLAVFWDVDGTIADTELSGHRFAFNRSFNDFDLDWMWNVPDYIELLQISGGLKRILHYRDIHNYNISDKLCSDIQDRKRFHYKELILSGCIKPRDGVLRTIEELASNKIDQFIVTTSSRDSLEPLLNTSLKNHSKYFKNSITYEDVVNHKPYPDAYNLAIKLSKYSPSNCLVLEDSNNGGKAARSANLSCLMVIPEWFRPLENVYKAANSCVDSFGDYDNPSKLIYGKEMKNRIVDFEYLNNILNN